MQAFRSAVHGALGTVDDSKTQTPLKFKVEGDTGKKVSYDNCIINFQRLRAEFYQPSDSLVLHLNWLGFCYAHIVLKILFLMGL